MTMLPLRDVGSALRVATRWRDAAEAVFRKVAARNNLVRGSLSWRGIVQAHANIHWTSALEIPGSLDERWSGLHDIENGRFKPLTLPCPGWIEHSMPHTQHIQGGSDLYVMGSGLPIGNATPRRSWRLEIRNPRRDINGCGFAIRSAGLPNEVLVAVVWNGHCQFFEDAGCEKWLTETSFDWSEDSDDDEDHTFYGHTILEVDVELDDLGLCAHLYEIDRHGERRDLMSHCDELLGHGDGNPFDRCAVEGEPKKLRGDLIIGPFVRLRPGPRGLGSGSSARLISVRL